MDSDIVKKKTPQRSSPISILSVFLYFLMDLKSFLTFTLCVYVFVNLVSHYVRYVPALEDTAGQDALKLVVESH